MIKKKKQLIFIHGGMTFKNRSEYLDFLKNMEVSFDNAETWNHSYLDKSLNKYFAIHRLRMPLKENANYEDWKIVFEKYLPLLEDGVVLIGYSLGGIFLAKYLSENVFPKKLAAVYLLAAPYDDSLPGERLLGGFVLKKDLSLILKNCAKTRFLFSQDDTSVPLSQAKKYRASLPQAYIGITNKGEGHFRAEKLPELIKLIKDDCGL